MPIWVIDFETFFDSKDGYTLKKMTTEAYVRDPRFKIHCIGIWSPTYLIRPIAIRPDELDQWVHDGSGCTFTAQKAQFDGLILSHHFGIKPKGWIDTLSMARAIHKDMHSHSLDALAQLYGLPAKTIDYKAFDGMRDLTPEVDKMLRDGVIWDVALTARIAHEELKVFPRGELKVVDQDVRMFTEPAIHLDVPLVQNEYERIKHAKQQALTSLGVDKKDLASAEKFSALLRARGVEPPTKESPTTPGKLIPAFAKKDEGMIALLNHRDPVVAALAAARLGEKSSLQEKACERLLAMAGRGPLCVSLNYSGAHTHRVSSFDKINWLNFTRGSALRRSLVAPDGFKFVGADSAQIEARFVNWLAGQTDIVEAFRSGRDIYSENATIFYQKPINKKEHPNERHLGKTIELACGFRMGWWKFQLTCKQGALGGPPIILSDEDCKKAIEVYRRSHPMVVALWKKYDKVLEDMLHLPRDKRRINLPNGLWLDYWDLHVEQEEGQQYPEYVANGTRLHGGVIVENIIQALARVFMTDVRLSLQQTNPNYKLINFPYDELLYLVPENDNTALGNILAAMKTPSKWCETCPVDAEGWEGKRYSK